MSGYWTSYGYIGIVNGVKMLFASDSEYYEFLEESSKIIAKGEIDYEQTFHHEQDA